MKTRSSKTFCSAYLSVSKDARRLQSELLNIVDEVILTTWPVARGGQALGEELSVELERLLGDSYYRLNPVCVNLLETLKKVVELQAKAYEIRDIPGTQK